MSELFGEETSSTVHARQIEEKVVQISAIQQEFSQKLMAQKESIAAIETFAQQSTARIDNMKVHLDKALQCAATITEDTLRHGRHFRVFIAILLFLCAAMLAVLYCL